MVDPNQLNKKIEALPDSLLAQVADYVDFLIDRNDLLINSEIPYWQIKETEKRLQQIEIGKVKLVLWEDVKASVFKK